MGSYGDFDDPDRTVHASNELGWQLVRYDRAGKWYFEHHTEPRQHVTLGAAVNRVTRMPDWEIYLDLPGGRLFDHRVRKTGAA